MANYTILLIDYEPRSIERFREPLVGAGYTIEIATDGISGIEAFHRLKPDMVLVEAMIPKKHGFEVCQELKRTPHGRRTPVLITTGVYKGRKYRTQALHIYGCDEYIEKPIAPEQLLKIVGKFFGSAASAPAHRATEPGTVPKTAPSAEPPAPENHRTKLTSVPQTIAEDGAEDEIIARLDAILPGGDRTTQVVTDREPVAVVAATEQDPFAQMRAELDAELGSLSAALAFEPTLVPSDQAVSPSVLEALPVPEAQLQLVPPLPPTPAVADERAGQVVDFVPKRSRKNRKSERQSAARPPNAPRIVPAPEPIELTLPPGTLVASQLEPAAGRSGMPAWLWAGLGLLAIVTVYFVFAGGGSNGDDAVPLQPASDAVPVAEAPPVASAPLAAPSEVPERGQGVPDGSKRVHNAVAVPTPKKAPDRVAKVPVASVPAPKPPVVPPVVPPVAPPTAAEAAKSTPPRSEPEKASPAEATPPSGLEDSVAGVEAVPDFAAAPATTIAPGTLIPIDEADTLPVALSHRVPVYSLQARQMRLAGAVVMNVLVNERGTVDQVVLVTGIPGAGINDAAVKAAESWTYRPATKNGVPVKVWKSEQIVFKL